MNPSETHQRCLVVLSAIGLAVAVLWTMLSVFFPKMCDRVLGLLLKHADRIIVVSGVVIAVVLMLFLQRGRRHKP